MVKFLNAANLISLLRVFLAIPLWRSVSSINQDSGLDSIYWFLGLCILISITDLFDGYFARLFGTVTDLGKFLDPVADKVCVFVLIVHLSLSYPQFSFFCLCLLVRDLIVSVMSLYFARVKNKFLQANIFGKWFLFFIGMTMLFFIIDTPSAVAINQEIKMFFYWMSWALFVLSSAIYLRDFFRHWRY